MVEKIEKKIAEKKKQLATLTEKIKIHLSNVQRHQEEANRLHQLITGLNGEIKALSELLEN